LPWLFAFAKRFLTLKKSSPFVSPNARTMKKQLRVFLTGWLIPAGLAVGSENLIASLNASMHRLGIEIVSVEVSP
jgi:hypothetical protein